MPRILIGLKRVKLPMKLPVFPLTGPKCPSHWNETWDFFHARITCTPVFGLLGFGASASPRSRRAGLLPVAFPVEKYGLETVQVKTRDRPLQACGAQKHQPSSRSCVGRLARKVSHLACLRYGFASIGLQNDFLQRERGP